MTTQGKLQGGKLQGRTALITGSSRNIGRTIALTFAREGANLVLNTRSNSEELEEAASECRSHGVEVVTCLADVSQHEEASRLVREAQERMGQVDILVHNAAIRPHRPVVKVPVEEWRQVMAVNLDACFYLCQAAVPNMMERRHGNIIALGGQANMAGRIGTGSVTASKMGLQGLMRVLAMELAPYGIRANMVMPGAIDTERRSPEWYPERLPTVSDTPGQPPIPLGREGTPQDVANACLFLASDDSAYVTGDRILVMGGRYVS